MRPGYTIFGPTGRLDIRHTWDGGPLPSSEMAQVDLITEDDGLHVMVRAPYHGDPPPAAPPGHLPGLWNHEVVELFIAGPGHRYLELELGPAGHHLVLQLDGIRQVVNEQQTLQASFHVNGDVWWAECVIPLEWLPPPPWKANAFRIHGPPDARIYLASTPLPGPRPDFHQPDRFEPLDLPEG